jgi:hypothetical protein
MSIIRGVTATALSLAAVLSISACSQPAAPPAANTAEAPTGTSTDTSSTTTTTTAGVDTTGLAPACVQYINTVSACVNRLSNNNPAGAEQFRRQMTEMRQRLQGLDEARATQVCTQASNIFNGLSRMMGCGS